MRRALSLALVGLALPTLAALDAGASPQLVQASAQGNKSAARTQPPQNNFRSYPTCNAAQPGPAPRDNTCREGDGWGAVLRWSRDHAVRYRICIRRPDHSHDCYRRRASDIYTHRQEDGLAETALGQTGVFRLTWKVQGYGVIDRDLLRVAAR